MVDVKKWSNWDKLEKGTALFILDQGEKNLKEILEGQQILTDRATGVMQITIPSIALVCGFIYSEISLLLPIYLAINGLGFLIIITGFAMWLFRSHQIVPVGNEPNRLINKEKVNHKLQELVFTYNAIKTVQNSIRANRKSNNKRVRLWRIMEGLIFIGLLSEIFLCPIIYYFTF